MKRTLVTALLLPFFLLTVGSLGCKAAALPLSAPVAAAMAEEGLSSTQQSACYSQQAGALERLTRQKTRDQAQEALQVMLTDTALTQEQKDELTAQAGGMVQAIETEGRIENRIKAKGFDECMVYCSSEKVDVIVKAPELQEGQVVQIRDIILGETKVPVENISIVSVK